MEISVRLYFTNYEHRPDDEEFEEVVSILKQNHCKFVDNRMGQKVYQKSLSRQTTSDSMRNMGVSSKQR